jgi:hypothetical protein
MTTIVLKCARCLADPPTEEVKDWETTKLTIATMRREGDALLVTPHTHKCHLLKWVRP